MTTRSRRPTRHNRQFWTAYERAHGANTTNFDHDAHSCMHGRGVWPDIGDIESLTLLSGLSDA